MSKRKRIYKYENGWKRSALKIFNLARISTAAVWKQDFRELG